MAFSSLPLISRLILALGLLLALGAGGWAGLSERRLLAAWSQTAPGPEPTAGQSPLMALNHLLLAKDLSPKERLERLRALAAEPDLGPQLHARVLYEVALLTTEGLPQTEDLPQRAQQIGHAIEALEQALALTPAPEVIQAAQTYLSALRPQWARLQRALGDEEMRRLAGLEPEALIKEIEALQQQARQGDKKAQQLGRWAIEVLDAKTQNYPWFPLLEAAP